MSLKANQEFTVRAVVLILAVLLVIGINAVPVAASQEGASDIHRQNSVQISVSESSPDAQIAVSIQDRTVEAGANTTVTVTITNVGANATAGSIRLNTSDHIKVMSSNPIFLGFGGTEAPKSGESVTQKFDVKINESTPTGTYDFSVDAELSNTAGDDKVSATTSLDVQEEVRPAPALTVNVPQQVSPGTTFTAEYIITNRASNQAGGGSIKIINTPPKIKTNGQSTQFIGVSNSPPGPDEQITKRFELTVNQSVSTGQNMSLVANVSLQYSDGSKATNKTTSTIEIVSSPPIDRFDTNGRTGIQPGEVVDSIVAYNSGSQVGGQSVRASDVVDLIVAYNN